MNTSFSDEEIRLVQGAPFSAEYARLLNNLYMRFRLGTKPVDPVLYGTTPDGWYRSLSKELGRWTCIHESLVQGDDAAECSRKWMLQTDEAFYAEIDKTVKDLGMSLEAVEETCNRMAFAPSGGALREKTFRSAFFLHAPIYRALRLKGYSQHDLIS